MKKGLTKTNRLIAGYGLLMGVLFACLNPIATPVKAAAGINQTINFQGRLLNAQGATVPDGFYNIEFKIYQDGDGQSAGDTTGSPAGTLKWTEDWLNTNSKGVKVVNGYLSVSLGSINPFGSNIDWNQSTLWLSMNIGGTGTSCTPFSSCSPDGEMVPMQPMTAAPYALNSGLLGGKSSAQFVQIAQGLQTDASNATAISINKTGTGNILDLQSGGSSVFVLSNSGAATITANSTNALLVRNSMGTGFLSVDTSGGTVKIGVTGVTSSNSTIHIADSSNGIQTVTIGSTSSSSATTINAGSGGIALNGDITVGSGKNFTQSGGGTFSTGSGANTLNGDTTIASGKNFTQSGAGTFSTGSGANTLNGDTTVAGTKNFTVNGGNTSLGGNLDVSGSAALKKGTDFSTTGTTNNANFGNASLIRLTGASAQTITGIANGRDGYMLTLVNAGSVNATLTNNDTNSSAANRIITGTGNSLTIRAGATLTLVYDSSASVWRADSANGTSLQSAYTNSLSPQITLSTANGGLIVQDASSPIGASLFTVQSNGGTTKYFNVDASTVAINDNLTVSGTYNTNTFTSTSLAFGGASGSVSSTGNLTIQAGSSNSLILDTTGSGSVSLGASNATTINVATSNVAHILHIGDGGTSAAQTITIGSSGAAASSVTINAGSSGGVTFNGSTTVAGSLSVSGTNSFSTGTGTVSLRGDTTIATDKNFTQNGAGTFSTGSGANSLNGDTTIASGKNFTQSGGGTFSTGSGANSLNGDTTIANGKNFTQSGTGSFSTGSGTNTLNGDTTVSGTKNFTVNGGNTTLGGNLDVSGSTALKKGTDFSTTGTTNNANFGNASLIRLSGSFAQTITGIAGGRDGYILTLINAGGSTATLTNNDSNSSAGNRIVTGTGTNISLLVNATVTLVYDSTSGVWRAGSVTSINNLQNSYNNSTSPQIVLSSANGGLILQDASTPIGAALFTVQSNGGTTKYFNVDATTVAVNDNLTVSGTYNTNTFTSTSLVFGGATGSVTSTGNLTIQAGSSNSLILDTSGSGSVSIASGNAGTVSIASNNLNHIIHIGDGGTSASQTVTIGSSGNVNSSVTINSGSTGGITLNGSTTVNGSVSILGTNSFTTGTGAVSLKGDTTIATDKNFTQSGAGSFATGSGANNLNGDTTVASGKNFTQSGAGTFSTGSGANSLNGDTTIATGKNFTQSGNGAFSTGSGTNTLNGDTTVAGTKNFTVNGGNTSLGGNLDVTGSTALKKGSDFGTTGTVNNANFANASLIRLTGTSAQTITGIAGGRDGYLLTLMNAGNTAATLTNNDSGSSLGNRIITGTNNSVTLPVGAIMSLVYDSSSAVWRAGSIGGGNLQTAYNNSTTSPQIVLSSANGGLVLQDASTPIGASLFTIQSNGGTTKYFNVDATTAAINDNLTVSGTYNTNTFTSTSLAFGGATGSVTSTGNLTIQAGSSNSLILDTGGAGTISLGAGNASNISIASNNATHIIHIGDGGTSAAQTVTIGSSGNAASSVSINAGNSSSIALNGNVAIASGRSFTQSGGGSFSTGTGTNNLNGDTVIASDKNFTQNGTGSFTTGSGTNTLSGNTVVATDKNFTQNGAGTFSTGTGAVSLNGDTTVASGKTLTARGDVLFKDAANSATAFQIQNVSNFNIMTVDASSNHLKVYDGTATQAYVDIYYDDATNSAVIAASSGTTKIGNGSGPITLNSGTAAAVNITGHATSTWSLDSGDLTIDVTGGSGNLNLGTGAQAKTINIGNGTGVTAVNVQCGTGTCGFGNNGTDHSTIAGSTSGTSLTTIQSGTGGITLSGNTTVASGKSLTANGTVLFKPSSNSTTSFQVQPSNSTTPVLNVDTQNSRIGINTNSPNAALEVNSGSAGVSGLRFTQLNSNSSSSAAFTQILGLDTNGNVGLSSASVALTSPALAYWDGINNPTTGSQSYPLATLSGNAAYDSAANGVRLTSATGNQSGSINWSFSQVPFEEIQFKYKAGGGSGADGTWFYSYADGTPTTEFGTGMTHGYIIYFSEWHDCIGITYGSYTDGNQCSAGGAGHPLAAIAQANLDDNQFHDVDIQIKYNVITVRFDSKVVLTYSDVYTRDTSSYLNFGFGARTGGSTNNHYIKGLSVTKLGLNNSMYGIADVSPLGSNLYWSNSTNTLTVGNSTTSGNIVVNGSTTLNSVGSGGTTALCLDGSNVVSTCAGGGGGGLTVNCSSTQTLNNISVSNGLVTSGTCTSNTRDLAEQYTSDQTLSPGEIVALSSGDYTSVERSTTPQQSNLLGVVSTEPWKVLGGTDQPDGYPIALAGEVPVKVNLEGGVIHKGDKITSSGTPGVGMKANGSGMVIGTALEDYDGTSGGDTIHVFVGLSYYMPNLQLQGTQNVTGDFGVTGNTSMQKGLAVGGGLNVSGDSTMASLQVTGALTVNGTANIANLTVQSLSVNGNLSVSGSATIQSLTVVDSITAQTVTINGVANFKGDIKMAAKVNTRQATIKSFAASKPITAGSVVILDNAPGKDGQVTTTTQPNDTRIIGVAVSDAAKEGDSVEVAIGGWVQVKVDTTPDANNNPPPQLTAGQLLTSSTAEGTAQTNSDPTPGAILGKTTSQQDSQTNLVWVLVTLQ